MTFLNRWSSWPLDTSGFEKQIRDQVRASLRADTGAITGPNQVSTSRPETINEREARRRRDDQELRTDALDPAGNFNRSAYRRECHRRAGVLARQLGMGTGELFESLRRIAEVRVLKLSDVCSRLESALGGAGPMQQVELRICLHGIHRHTDAYTVRACSDVIDRAVPSTRPSLTDQAGAVVAALNEGPSEITHLRGRGATAEAKARAFELSRASTQRPFEQLATMARLARSGDAGRELVMGALTTPSDGGGAADTRWATLLELAGAHDGLVDRVLAAHPDILANAARLDEKMSEAAGLAEYGESTPAVPDAAGSNDPAIDMDAAFPTESKDMEYQAHAGGFKETNTGRQLYIRRNGRRLSLFDGKGNYVMDVDRDSLRVIEDQVASAERAVRNGTYETYLKTAGRPQLGHGVADSSQYAGQILKSIEIDNMGRKALSLACSINGIATSPDTHVMQQRLLRHMGELRSKLAQQTIQNNRALREERDLLTSRVMELTDKPGAVSEELQGLQRANRNLTEQCERLQGDQSSMRSTIAELRQLAAEVQGSYDHQGREVLSLRDRVVELEQYERAGKDALEIERRAQESLESANVARLEAAEDRAATEARLAAERAGYAQAEKATLALEAAQARIKVLERKQQLAIPAETNTDMDTQHNETEMEFPTPPATAAPSVPARPGNPVANMFTDALQLAAVQQSSKLLVDKVTPLAIKAGVNEDFIKNPQVRGILELALPFMLSQYAHMVPGLKKMDALPQLSQQQLVMGLADVIGISLQQLLGIGVEVIGALNAGVDSDPLKAAKDLLDGDGEGEAAAAE